MGGILSPSPGFPTKIWGKGGTVHVWWEQQSNSKRGAVFGKRRDAGGIILGENPAGHCFVLKNLVLTSFFN